MAVAGHVKTNSFRNGNTNSLVLVREKILHLKSQIIANHPIHATLHGLTIFISNQSSLLGPTTVIEEMAVLISVKFQIWYWWLKLHNPESQQMQRRKFQATLHGLATTDFSDLSLSFHSDMEVWLIREAPTCPSSLTYHTCNSCSPLTKSSFCIISFWWSILRTNKID